MAFIARLRCTECKGRLWSPTKTGGYYVHMFKSECSRQRIESGAAAVGLVYMERVELPEPKPKGRRRR